MTFNGGLYTTSTGVKRVCRQYACILRKAGSSCLDHEVSLELPSGAELGRPKTIFPTTTRLWHLSGLLGKGCTCNYKTSSASMLISILQYTCQLTSWRLIAWTFSSPVVLVAQPYPRVILQDSLREREKRCMEVLRYTANPRFPGLVYPVLLVFYPVFCPRALQSS